MRCVLISLGTNWRFPSKTKLADILNIENVSMNARPTELYKLDRDAHNCHGLSHTSRGPGETLSSQIETS